MSNDITDINDLRLNDRVIDGIYGGYAKVKRCPHGNKYYAMLSWIDNEIPARHTLPIVYDTDIDYITCCG